MSLEQGFIRVSRTLQLVSMVLYGCVEVAIAVRTGFYQSKSHSVAGVKWCLWLCRGKDDVEWIVSDRFDGGFVRLWAVGGWIDGGWCGIVWQVVVGRWLAGPHPFYQTH
jgi:hypothetical protein